MLRSLNPLKWLDTPQRAMWWTIAALLLFFLAMAYDTGWFG